MDDPKLTVLLAEHTRLREELEHRLGWFIQIYSIYIGAIVVYYGTASFQHFYDVITLIPLIALSLFWRILWDQYIVAALSNQMAVVAAQINKMFAPSTPASEDSESVSVVMAWDTLRPFDAMPPYYKYSLIGVFVVCSCIPAFLYHAYNLLAISTSLPSLGNMTGGFLAVFSCLGIIISAGSGTYMTFKTIKGKF